MNSAAEGVRMMEQFTDHARTALRRGFRCQAASNEQDLIAVLAQVGVSARLLQTVGVAPAHLPTDARPVEQQWLVGRAVETARRREADYVGTEHLLLALARRPASALAALGASVERISQALSVIEVERRRRHLPLARRIGAWCSVVLRRTRG